MKMPTYDSVISMRKGVKANNPIMIVGLPGIGGVGKLVAEHLKREFGAKRFATLRSPHFPHQVVMQRNGGVRIVNNRFYIIKRKEKGTSDIIILTGDTQATTPEGQYEVNLKIVDFFKNKLNGKFIYTVGGYNLGGGIVKAPRVFGNATSQAVIDKLKGTEIIFGKSRGLIWGSAGMVIAFAKMRKIEGVCLMGETGMLDVDANAAKSVILTLSKLLKLKVNTTNLDKIIAKTAEAIRELEAQAALSASHTTEKSGERPSYIR